MMRLVILALPAAALLAEAAGAMSFYPMECCHDRDCWPMGDAPDAREPEPLWTARGWQLADGAIVPFNAARASPDGRFHICRRGGELTGEKITPPGQPLCFWAPQPNS